MYLIFAIAFCLFGFAYFNYSGVDDWPQLVKVGFAIGLGTICLVVGVGRWRRAAAEKRRLS